MEKTREALKARYKRGMVPTEGDYGDWMDSFVHKSEGATIEKTAQDAATVAKDAMEAVKGLEKTQAVVRMGAGELKSGKTVKLTHKLGRVPCVRVFVAVEGGNVWMEEVKASKVGVALGGEESMKSEVLVTVEDTVVDGRECIVVLN